MRFRMGKGQVLVFDASVEKKMEELYRKNGFYPTLKEIGESHVPPTSANYIDRALRRLAAAGRLSKEALLVYNAKNNLKYIKGDTTHENRKSSKAKK